jgi:hypothetical protein
MAAEIDVELDESRETGRDGGQCPGVGHRANRAVDIDLCLLYLGTAFPTIDRIFHHSPPDPRLSHRAGGLPMHGLNISILRPM